MPVNELDCFRHKALERELWFARGRACLLRAALLVGVLYVTPKLGWTVVAGGTPAAAVPFVIPALAVLGLYGLHRARFLDRLAIRAEARLNRLTQGDGFESETLAERSFAWNGGVTKTEFDPRRGAWLSALVVGVVGVVWILLMFRGCQEAIRMLLPRTFALILWQVSFVAWIVGAGQLFWLHFRRPPELPSAVPPTQPPAA